MQTFMRLDRGVPLTLARLVVKPWVVIRDVISGRRVTFCDPFKLLMILSFFYVVLAGMFNVNIYNNLTLPEEDASSGAEWIKAGFDFIDHSVIAQTLIIIVPLTLSAWLAFGKRARRRFNLAEFLVAGVYFGCLSLAFGILMLPMERFQSVLDPMVNIYLGVLAMITAKKAFHITVGQTVWRTLLCCALFAAILVAILAIPLILLGVSAGVL